MKVCQEVMVSVMQVVVCRAADAALVQTVVEAVGAVASLAVQALRHLVTLAVPQVEQPVAPAVAVAPRPMTTPGVVRPVAVQQTKGQRALMLTTRAHAQVVRMMQVRMV